MAILAYVGLMGDGKSYGVVDNVILKNLRAGRVVWSNIPMMMDVLNKEIPDHKFHQITEYDDRWKTGEALADVPKGTITVLDELWTVLPAGMKANHVPAAWKHFIAEHRHEVGEDGFTSEIVFVTQDLADIAAFARNKVQRTFMVRKLWTIGANNRFVVDIFRGAITGQRGPETAKMGTAAGKYEPEVYKFYRSHTKGGGKIGHEAVADKRGVIWKHPYIMFGVPLAVAAVAFAIWNGTTALYGMGDNKAAELTRSPAARQTSNVRKPDRTKGYQGEVATVQPADEADRELMTGRRYSKRWRVTGIVQKESGGGMAYLEDGKQMHRIVPLDACKWSRDLFDDIVCIVEDEAVTQFSGTGEGWLPALVKTS